MVTPDLDATLAFYGDVLGMQVGDIYPSVGERGRHCFIKPGTGETWGLHFFEHVQAELFPHPGLTERFAFVAGALQHIAFGLPTEADALALRECLHAHDVPTTDINTLGPIRNFLFIDNNGMQLEATWPKT